MLHFSYIEHVCQSLIWTRDYREKQLYCLTRVFNRNWRSCSLAESHSRRELVSMFLKCQTCQRWPEWSLAAECLKQHVWYLDVTYAAYLLFARNCSLPHFGYSPSTLSIPVSFYLVFKDMPSGERMCVYWGVQVCQQSVPRVGIWCRVDPGGMVLEVLPFSVLCKVEC